MESNQIDQVMISIENNIEKCDVLKWVLKTKMDGGTIDYNWYQSKGYKDEEVKIGAELVELYLILKNHIAKVN